MYKNKKVDWEKQQMVLCLFRKNDKSTTKVESDLQLEESNA
jgi:hypothetical protein